MKMKTNAVVAAALAALTLGGAQAAINLPGASSTGNSSALFVAHDQNNQITLVVDLGVNMIDLLQGSSLMSGLSNGEVTWNFANSTVTGASITGNDWSAAYNTFKSTQAGGDLVWGVIAADSVQGSGTTVTATNAIAGRGWLATGNATVAQMLAASTSGPTGNGLTAANGFWSSANNLGNMITAGNGAGTATSGDVFGAMGGNFLGSGTWNYLVGNNVASTFQYQRQTVANPNVFQLGLNASLTDTLNATPVTFRFDLATDSLVLAVPEPGTYALMLAGLVGVGFVARRRQQR